MKNDPVDGSTVTLRVPVPAKDKEEDEGRGSGSAHSKDLFLLLLFYLDGFLDGSISMFSERLQTCLLCVPLSEVYRSSDSVAPPSWTLLTWLRIY